MGLSYNPTIVSDGLVFALDAANSRSYSGTGNTVFGITGGINGTLVNGVGFTSSNNGSFVFDGSNDVIDLGDNFDMGLASFSFCTYFKANAVSGLQGIFSKSIAAAAGSRYALFIQNSKIYPFMSMGGADVNTPSTLNISANTWYHVGAVYDRTDKLTLYINGSFDSATTITQFIANDFQASHIFRIGSYSDASNNAAYFLNGFIPQLQIYNRVLSATEIQQNYNATKGRFGL
jgi:hypothetical protein